MSTLCRSAGVSCLRSMLGLLLAVVLLLVSLPTLAVSQQPVEAGDSIYELRVGDGSRAVGRIIEVRENQVVFETIAGVRMEVNRAFARFTPARGRIVDGEFWAEDKHTTRLFFAPTGRTLRAGDAYAGLFLILPFVGYGASDNITLAGGLPPFGSLGSVPVWIAPKLRVHNTPTSQISTGVFAVYMPGYMTSEWHQTSGTYRDRREPGQFVGIAYGVGTFGNLDNALHAGTGVTFGGDDVEVPVMVGGEFRMSRRHKFISENWLFPTAGSGALSGGVRFIGDRWTTDLGLMALLGGASDWDGEQIPYFPILSFSYAFGGRR